MKLLVAVLMSICSTVVVAQSFTEVVKKVAADRAAGDGYGYSVAVSGDRAIVGVPEWDFVSVDTTMLGAGAVYIYGKDEGAPDGWGLEVQLVAPDMGVGDEFGYSVDIDGDYIIVGAHKEDEDGLYGNTLISDGAAYIYKYDGLAKSWNLLRKLVAPDRADGDAFGYSVGITSDYAVVGARNESEDVNGSNTILNAGSAYVFQQNKGGADVWGYLTKITAGNRGNSAFFGDKVAIDGDYILVSSPSMMTDADELNPLSGAGAAYVFNKDEGGADNWGQTAKITPSDRAANDRFGEDCALSLPYILIGAHEEDEDVDGLNTLTNPGAAYIFSLDESDGSCTELKKLVADDRKSNQSFGIRVSIDGDFAAVGASFERWDENGLNPKSSAGAVYVFEASEGGKDNWGQVQKIVHSDRDAGDLLGSDVAIAGNILWCGAEAQETDEQGLNPLSSAGAAYVFQRSTSLPVEWIRFQVERAYQNSVLLTWQTAAEQNNEGFRVERSSDGLHWEAIGFVAGKGHSVEVSSYAFRDMTPMVGDNYYRLAQVDWGGRTEYSVIKSIVVATESTSPAIFPNPVRDELTVQHGEGLIRVFNSLGQVIYNEYCTSSILRLDTSAWRAGWYHITIIQASGSVVDFNLMK